METNYKKIDKRRTVCRQQAIIFLEKLAEWSLINEESHGDNEVIRFCEFAKIVPAAFVCKIAGVIFSPFGDQIENRDYSIFSDEKNIGFIDEKLTELIGLEDLGDETFDFYEILKKEDQTRSPEIQDAFWKRCMICYKAYRLLSEVDDDMPMYTIP